MNLSALPADREGDLQERVKESEDEKYYLKENCEQLSKMAGFPLK